MFQEVKQKVKARFEGLAAAGVPFFTVTTDRDIIWDAYINGFSDEERQGHNCNACKSFLRQWGNIVAIQDNKKVSIWDIEDVPGEFQQSISNLAGYIHSLPITDVFLAPTPNVGTDSNFDSKKDIVWNHFALNIPSQYVRSADSIPTLLGQAREDVGVLNRALNQFSIENTDVVLDLIAQNSLYRGNEHEALLKSFRRLQVQFKDIENPVLFAWTAAAGNTAVARIRNSVIGSLLVDLAEGKELDVAVGAFETKVAPTNYKRPTALISASMIEAAKKRLVELGLDTALQRRFAVPTDISVNHVLFVDRSSGLVDTFDELKKDVKVNPRSLSKVEEIGIEDFLNHVLPNTKGLYVLPEDRHLNNFVSLLAPVDPDAGQLFKWDNPFSWSYTNGVTDSIKERVKRAGGRVEGELRISLSWHNLDDLDLHVYEPVGGQHIWYSHKISSLSGGNLDVDMNAGSGKTREPVENIIFPDKTLMITGTYEVAVNQFQKRETTEVGYTVEIEHDGQIYTFGKDLNPGSTDNICRFVYSKSRPLEFTYGNPSLAGVSSKEKWGVKTNQFSKVKLLSLSPNFWESAVGNRHFIFALENCVNDESPRPFFNEFLKESLSQDRKVFEVLGSKIKVEPSSNQVSGLGFSDTQRDHLFVKVEGSFARTLKVLF